MKPRLAAFPKCYMDQLCVDRTMTVLEWIELASTLGVDGLEFYSGFLEDDEAFLGKVKAALDKHSLAMPMLCCSPDFTEPDPALLEMEIAREKRMIEITAFFGGHFCRALSGQRRPGLSRQAGVAQVVRVIKDLLPFAEKHGVVLNMENHYKDNYWKYPEFAQKMDVFVRHRRSDRLALVRRQLRSLQHHPGRRGPARLLERVKHRVVTMHASDRYLKTGTIEDLRKEEDSVGYASRLSHGVIGKGMNDYDKIFSTLHAAGFHSWISIEDGMNGMDDLRESVRFLRNKIDQHFTN